MPFSLDSCERRLSSVAAIVVVFMATHSWQECKVVTVTAELVVRPSTMTHLGSGGVVL